MNKNDNFYMQKTKLEEITKKIEETSTEKFSALFFYENLVKELKEFKNFKNEINFFENFFLKERRTEDKYYKWSFFDVPIKDFHVFLSSIETKNLKNVKYYRLNIHLWIFITIKKKIKKLLNITNKTKNKEEKWNEWKEKLDKKILEINEKVKLIINEIKLIINEISNRENLLNFEMIGIKSWIIVIDEISSKNSEKKKKMQVIYWLLKLHFYDLEKEFDHLSSTKKTTKNKINKEEIEPWNFFQKLILELKNDSNIWNNFFVEKINFLYLKNNILRNAKKIKKISEEREGYYLFENAIYKEEVQKYYDEQSRDSLNYQKLKEDKKIFQTINISLKEILETFKFNDQYLFDDKDVVKDINNSIKFLKERIIEIENKIELINEKIKKIKKKYKNKNGKSDKEKWFIFKITGLNLTTKILSSKRIINKEYLDFESDFSLKRKKFIDEKNKEKKEAERQLDFKLSYHSIKLSRHSINISEKEVKNSKIISRATLIMAIGTIFNCVINIWMPIKEEEKLKWMFFFGCYILIMIIIIIIAMKVFNLKEKWKKNDKKIKNYKIKNSNFD